MKSRSLFSVVIAFTLCTLAVSCVKEQELEDRVAEIVKAQQSVLNQKVDSLVRIQEGLSSDVGVIKDTLDEIVARCSDLSRSIDEVKTELQTEYDWTEGQLDTVGMRIDSLADVQRMLVAAVYERLGKLESRIQKIDVVPYYADGGVRICKSGWGVPFVVSPDSIAKKLADGFRPGDSRFVFMAKDMLTRSSAGFDTLAINAVSYGGGGIITALVDGSALPEAFYDTVLAYSGCLVITDGNNDMTSGFFPLKPAVIYPEASDSQCVKIGGVWWAPVNCGYDENHKSGLLYQWGRKYGQAYEAQTISPVEMTMEEGQQYVRRNKCGLNVFNNNWFSGTSLIDTLWEDTGGAYDPCPAGWRVPTAAELGGLAANYSVWSTLPSGQKGRFFSGGTPYSETVPRMFIPAAGYRETTTGVPSGRNVSGTYWSSSTNGGNVSYLLFNVGGVGMNFSSARASGYAVRCVQK